MAFLIKDQEPTKGFNLFLAYAILVEAGILVYLFTIPPDPKNQVIFGFSLARLAVAVGMLGLLAVTTACLFLARRQHPWYLKIRTWLSHPIAGYTSALLALAYSYFSSQSFELLLPNRYIFARLQPIFLLILLLAVGILLYQLVGLRRRPWRRAYEFMQSWASRPIDSLAARVSTRNLMLLALLVAAPLIFYLPFRYAFPTGYAGLYSLMSDEIAHNGFALPVSVPFYGPGGIPFAYPPAGFYLMGLVVNVIGVPVFTYLRFAPPLFTLLSLVPLFIIAVEITNSRLAAFISALVVAGSQRIIMIQATAAGSVRGLANLFVLIGMAFFLVAYRKTSWKLAALAGLFVGLTALTHLGYAVFAALFACAFLLTRLFTKKTWGLLSVMGGVTAVVVLPWALVVAQRYGWPIFINAFQSHGNDEFLRSFTSIPRLMEWLGALLGPLLHTPLLWGLVLLGLIIALNEMKGLPIVWFISLIALTSESDRYLIIIGAMMAGFAVARIYHTFWPAKVDSQIPSIHTVRSLAFVFFVTFALVAEGWNSIENNIQPAVYPETLSMARFVQANTPADGRYLALVGQQEAEWLPYLLKRTPSISTWGAEWLGTYYQQLNALGLVDGCRQVPSLACIRSIIARLDAQPDYLITLVDEPGFKTILAGNTAWKELYHNNRYYVWALVSPSAN